MAAAHPPVWIVHGGRDPVVKVEWSYSMAAALEAAGHTGVRLTVHEDQGHDVWGRVYAGEDLYRYPTPHDVPLRPATYAPLNSYYENLPFCGIKGTISWQAGVPVTPRLNPTHRVSVGASAGGQAPAPAQPISISHRLDWLRWQPVPSP